MPSHETTNPKFHALTISDKALGELIRDDPRIQERIQKLATELDPKAITSPVLGDIVEMVRTRLIQDGTINVEQAECPVKDAPDDIKSCYSFLHASVPLGHWRESYTPLLYVAAVQYAKFLRGELNPTQTNSMFRNLESFGFSPVGRGKIKVPVSDLDPNDLSGKRNGKEVEGTWNEFDE